jgi:hypothetical protein
VKHTKVYQWYLVVEGAGSFPFDMLRYDACFPFEQTDAVKLEDHHTERRRVVLVRRGLNDSKCNGERWASFGWTVLLASVESGEAREMADAYKTKTEIA